MKKRSEPMSPEALQLVAERFRLLGEPMRLRILQELESGEQSVSLIAEALQTTQPNVSKHLKMMQDAGIIARRQDGNTVYYSIADQSVYQLCDVVCGSLRQHFEMHAGAFGQGVFAQSATRRSARRR